MVTINSINNKVNNVAFTNSGSNDATLTLGTTVIALSTSLTLNQDLSSTSSPTFSGLTVGSSSGLVKLTAGVFGTASSGTDYAPATSGTSILKGNGSGGFSSASSGTDYAPATSGTSILKGNGSGGFSNASAGTDYQAPLTNPVTGTGTSGQVAVMSGTSAITSSDTFTFAGGVLSLGKASTTVGGITLYNATNTNTTSIQSGVATATVTYTLPVNAPASNGYVLSSTTGGTLSWTSNSVVFPWTEVTGTTQALASNNGYIANNAGLVTLTLPATASIGDVIELTGKGAGGWKIAQNASQTIYFGSANTTAGATGYLASTNRRDTVKLVCITADTDFNVISSIGNITVV